MGFNFCLVGFSAELPTRPCSYVWGHQRMALIQPFEKALLLLMKSLWLSSVFSGGFVVAGVSLTVHSLVLAFNLYVNQGHFLLWLLGLFLQPQKPPGNRVQEQKGNQIIFLHQTQSYIPLLDVPGFFPVLLLHSFYLKMQVGCKR